MRAPEATHLPAIERLLADNALPIDDLGELDLSLFLFEGTVERVDAVGGLEALGDFALLRSIAVSEALRGQGRARAIVTALEALAGASGFRALYLLTESADRYFEGLGYARVERADVPEAVRACRQFASLCPDDAVVMCKRTSA